MTRTIQRFGIGIAAALLALATGIAVYASTQNTAQGDVPFSGARHGRGPGFGPFLPLGRMAAQLGLTDAQKDQIKTIAQSHREEWTALADRMGTARKALNDAVTAETIDENLIRQRVSELSAVEADAAIARAHARAEMFQVLTPDQRTKAKQLLADRQTRFGQLRERFMERLGNAK